jgi:hypothetical protein
MFTGSQQFLEFIRRDPLRLRRVTGRRRIGALIDHPTIVDVDSDFSIDHLLDR